MTASIYPPVLTYEGRAVAVKYHRLLSGVGNHPPNSLPALEDIIAGGAEVIEFDIRALAGGDYVLLHDASFERETTGAGPVASSTAAAVRQLTHRGGDVRLALLSEVTAVLRQYTGRLLKVQVDVKDTAPFTADDAERVLEAIAPLRANPHLRVVVGTLADWNLRVLRRIDSTLQVGLDFLIYLDAPVPGEFPRLPTRVNAFGYLDDHPLGWMDAAPGVRAYLEDRIESLCHLVPGAVEVYLRKDFLTQALRDGVNPVDVVRRACGDVGVDVWTINAAESGADASLADALAAGATQITTDTAVQLAARAPSAARS